MCVYFIQEIESGCIKIGHSIDPIGRLKAMQGYNPNSLKLLKVINGGHKEEKILHKLFFRERIRTAGEWFVPSVELVKFINLKDGNIINCISIAEKRFKWDKEVEFIMKFEGDTEDDINERIDKYNFLPNDKGDKNEKESS
jgi:hypothetical protein